jgi:hypothetical protein
MKQHDSRNESKYDVMACNVAYSFCIRKAISPKRCCCRCEQQHNNPAGKCLLHAETMLSTEVTTETLINSV